MPNWSKAPRGLFVLVWAMRIFTHTSISPGPSLRQRPDRYAIRAGRNLPDKEFRYLRTVIVTAAVHRGFSSRLRAPLPLTFRHWAGVSPYTSPCGFAETCGFVNQSPGPLLCAHRPLPPRGGSPPLGPLLPKLRGQVAEFLNEGSPVHLGLLDPPTGVGLRYGHSCSSRRGFSGLSGLTRVDLGLPRGLPFTAYPWHHRICLMVRATRFDVAAPAPRSCYPSALPDAPNGTRVVSD